MKQKFLTLLILFLGFNALCQHSSKDVDAGEKHQTSFQPPEIVLKAINIKEGMIVGEIGAGKGRYSVILANAVGKKGHIYANDIDKESLEYIKFRCKRDEIKNITTIMGTETDPLLPKNKLDMIFIVNTYHHIGEPVEIMKNAYSALKSTGTVAIVDGVPKKYSKHSHCATPKEKLIAQMKKAGYKFIKVAAELKRDNIYIFKKS